MASSISHEPEFMVCLECESPCYTFEWSPHKEKVLEAFCQVCGNDRLDQFDTDEHFSGELD